jgi:GGDEF domain-containing protein
MTLLGAGGRLVIALQDGRRTAWALARSHTDELTGLPNRRGLRVDASIARGDDLVLAVLGRTLAGRPA